MHHRALLHKQCFATGSDRGTGKSHPHGSLAHRTCGLAHGVGHPNCLWAMSEYEPVSQMRGMASQKKLTTRRAVCRASLPPRRYSWRRATVQSVVRNRDSCCGAPRGPRTMGTSVTGGASGAKTMGARSKTTVVQVPRRSSNEAGAVNECAGIVVTAPGAVVTVPVRMPVAASWPYSSTVNVWTVNRP